jgi:plastocyanin
MKIRTLVAVLAVSALVGAVVVGGASGATTSVTVGDNFFRPKAKTIARGDSIRWVWRGDVKHNVTGMTRSGRVAFRSKTTARKGYRYKKRFRKAARYRVICTLHSDMTMRVRVR